MGDLLLIEDIESKKKDAILWKAEHLITNAGEDHDLYSKAVDEIARMLNSIPNDIKRDSYMTIVSKKFKIKSKLLNSAVGEAAAAELKNREIHIPEGSKWRFPKGVDIEKALMNGFYALTKEFNTGYYFPSGGDSWTQQSNFIIKPLMHVRSTTEDKRIIEVVNAFGSTVIDMPSRDIISLDSFRRKMFELGNNLFYGTQNHLMKILSVIGLEFQNCVELKVLGWQQEGFFAYSNGIVTNDGFIPMDERGIAEFGGTMFYSPSASSIYKNNRKDDDEYSNDRYLFYNTPTINFEQWCEKVVNVYTEGNSGMTGVAYVLLSLFRDIHFKIDNNSPLLSSYGEKGSGKSKFMESLTSFFFNDLPPLNLFHSTDFAFSNRISRYVNCLVHGDEFNDSSIKEERFEAVKGAYDGTGRERGRGGSKNKTEMLLIRSSLGLTGQYMSTKDDNSALTRCIILPFKKRADETARTNDQVKLYNDLKTLEKEGISGILVEVLKFRKELEKYYAPHFYELFDELRTSLTADNYIYNERVMRNYCAPLTIVKFFSEKFNLSFTYDDFFQHIKKEIVKISNLINESDSLAGFWNTLVYLKETGTIQEGFHYKIDEVLEVATKTGKKVFAKPTKVLFLRLTTIHILYMQAHRSATGKSGVNQSTIELYLQSAKGYLGKSESSRFIDQQGKASITSSILFEYEAINVPLESIDKEVEHVLETFKGQLYGECKLKEVAGKMKNHFKLQVDQSYHSMGRNVEKIIFINCYDPNLENETYINSGHQFEVTGKYSVKRFHDKEKKLVENRILEVEKCNWIEEQAAPGENLIIPTDKQDDLPF